MKTRIRDMADGSYSFEYATPKVKNPLPHQWHPVLVTSTYGVEPVQSVATWPNAAKRDQARACFTHRRSVEAAMADLRRARLLPAT